MNNEICFSCSNKISPLGLYFKHYYGINDYRKSNTSLNNNFNYHYLCDDCLFQCVKVCVCDKNEIEEPKTFLLTCPCILDDNLEGDVEEYSKVYYNYNGQIIINLIHNYEKNIYMIDACKGCCFQDDEKKDLSILRKCSIISCVYSCIESQANEEKNNETNIDETNIDETKFTMIKYIADALNDDFIRIAKSCNYDIGKENEI